MKKWTMLLAMSMYCAFVVAQDQKELQTEITKVTVFSVGAQVHRTGKINLPEGKTLIKLTGLTPDLDPQSIMVKGNVDFAILSVAHEWNTSSLANNTKAMDSLNLVYKKLDRIMSQLKMRNEVLDQKLILLNENGHIGSETTGVTVDQLENALVLFENTLMHAHEEKLMITRQLDSMNLLKNEIAERISDLRGTPLTSKSEMEILVLTDHAVSSEIEISYIVSNAGWIPRYDIRAKDISQPIELVYKAEVHQQTGEAWKNVKLTFSNASPYARQTAPELKTWKLTTLANTTFKRIGPSELNFGTRIVTGRVIDANGQPLIFANVKVGGRSLGTQTDVNGDFSILLPQDANGLDVYYSGYETKNIPVTSDYLNINMGEETTQLDQLRNLPLKNINAIAATTAGLGKGRSSNYEEQVVIIENQISVEFELDNLTTILTDGKNSSLELRTYAMNADYHYETTPKIDHGAYLIATLANWEKYYLIEGQANLYFNNTYIGRTILDPINLSDTLEISLGRDPEVLVERVKEDEFTKKTFLGVNTIVEKSIKLSFRNKKQSAIHVIVTDQVPVSINDAISVTTTELSGGKKDENSGLITWDLRIEPTSNKDLRLRYSVKYPSRERVPLE